MLDQNYIAEIVREYPGGKYIVDPAERAANLKLMSEAPNLAHSLDMLLRIFDEQYEEGVMWQDKRIDKARAALAVARIEMK